MPDRQYHARYSPPRWWEHGLANYSLALWMLSWIARSIVGLAYVLGDAPVPGHPWAEASQGVAWAVLAVGSGFVLWGVFSPAQPHTLLNPIWNRLTWGFYLAAAGWVGYSSSVLGADLHRSNPQHFVTAGSGLLLCVTGVLVVRRIRRNIQQAHRKYESLKREVGQ